MPVIYYGRKDVMSKIEPIFKYLFLYKSTESSPKEGLSYFSIVAIKHHNMVIYERKDILWGSWLERVTFHYHYGGKHGSNYKGMELAYISIHK